MHRWSEEQSMPQDLYFLTTEAMVLLLADVLDAQNSTMMKTKTSHNSFIQRWP